MPFFKFLDNRVVRAGIMRFRHAVIDEQACCSGNKEEHCPDSPRAAEQDHHKRAHDIQRHRNGGAQGAYARFAHRGRFKRGRAAYAVDQLVDVADAADHSIISILFRHPLAQAVVVFFHQIGEKFLAEILNPAGFGSVREGVLQIGANSVNHK